MGPTCNDFVSYVLSLCFRDFSNIPVVSNADRFRVFEFEYVGKSGFSEYSNSNMDSSIRTLILIRIFELE